MYIFRWPFDCWSCCDTDSKICPIIHENLNSKTKTLEGVQGGISNVWGKNQTINRVSTVRSPSRSRTSLRNTSNVLSKSNSTVDRSITSEGTVKASLSRSLSVDIHKANKGYLNTKISPNKSSSEAAQSRSKQHSSSSGDKVNVIKQSDINSNIVTSKDANIPIKTYLRKKPQSDPLSTTDKLLNKANLSSKPHPNRSSLPPPSTLNSAKSKEIKPKKEILPKKVNPTDIEITEKKKKEIKITEMKPKEIKIKDLKTTDIKLFNTASLQGGSRVIDRREKFKRENSVSTGRSKDSQYADKVMICTTLVNVLMI